VSVLVRAAATARLADWWALSRDTRTTTTRVLGDLGGVQLDVGMAEVEIDGGASAVEVRRVDHFAFGRPSIERRSIDGDTLSIVSRCPRQVLGSCRASYRVTVPDNVSVQIDTSSGSVTLTGVRASVEASTASGAIAATGFCGFSLRSSSDTGDVSAQAECSADRLELRSRTGDVRAVVPAGRYQNDAHRESGSTRVRGLTPTDAAPFQIPALSTTGAVTLEAAS
jgi:hypothetical protein